jgi:erythromycin esterase
MPTVSVSRYALAQGIPFFLLLLLTPAVLSAQIRYPYNGSFESVNGDHVPKIWYSNNIVPAGSYAISSDSGVAFDGKRSVLIRPLEKYKKGAYAMIFQQLDLAELPPFKRLKIVEYVKTDVYPDSSLLFLGSNKICAPGEKPRHEEHTIEQVYKGKDMWYKVAYATDVDSNCLTLNCWNVVSSPASMYIDDFRFFLDDREIGDIPQPPDDYPAGDDGLWLNTHFRNLSLSEDGSLPADLTRDIAHSSIVGLGESTHGTSEFSVLKTNISKQLVEKHGFTVIAFENELGPSLDINAALLTEMPVKHIVDTFFSTIYRTKEMEDLLQWVRMHNRSSGKQVFLAGMDMQSYFSDIVRLKLLLAGDTALLPLLLKMSTLQQKARSAAEFDTLQNLALYSAALFRNHPVNKSRFSHKDNSKDKRLLADRLFTQLINAYKKKVLGYTTGMTNAFLPQEDNFRDSLMADNILWLNRVCFPGSKIIVWAHNEHITRSQDKTRADHLFKYTRTMGEYLEKDYPGKYKAFALLTGSGRITGFNNSGRPSESALEEPPVDSYEYYLNTCSGSPGYVSLDPAGIPDQHLRLFRYLRWRTLGFSGWNVPFRAYNLLHNFDGLFFVRMSTPVQAHF